MIIFLCTSGDNSLHDLAVNGLFVVCDEVQVEELLNLVWGEPREGISVPYETKRK